MNNRRQAIMDAVEKKAGLVRDVTPGAPLEHLCGAAADWIIRLQDALAEQSELVHSEYCNSYSPCECARKYGDLLSEHVSSPSSSNPTE